MSLSSFITSHREAILAEWEENARRRIVGDGDLEIPQLRDHLGELLDTVAHELDVRERGRAAETTSTGRVDAVAEKHGAGRAQQGMTVKQVVSEFPIMRSCVTHLWLRSRASDGPPDPETLVRFDEALDRALTQSVSEFTDRVDRARETFLGILSHDLRDPISTVITGGKLLLEPGLDEATTRELVLRIIATGERMKHLVADLLDAIRTQLGGPLPIQRREADLGETMRHIVGEFSTAHPDREVDLHLSGDLRGQWDDRRVGQAVANLVTNALQYGAADAPIDISATTDGEVRIAVHNDGAPIPERRRASLFELFGGVGDHGAPGDHRRLHLGLYIAKAIVDGHHGRIEVDSSAERGTTVTIHLPRVRSN